MASQFVYTETFLRLAADGANGMFVVPEMHRLIVTSVVCCQRGPVEGNVQVVCGDVVLVQRLLPGGSETWAWDMRAVAYQGEVLYGYSQWAKISLTVSGYLFGDTSGRTAPAGQRWTGRRPAVLPASIEELRP